MKIRGTTRVIGLLGYPVEHSLSPAMHNAAFEHLGLDYCYVAFPVRPEVLGEAVMAIRAFDLTGVNVTVPHKEKVMEFLDEVDEEASFIGAVNTIRNSNGRLSGFNTDGRGFMASLSEAGITVTGKNVVIIGAGGACRAISYYLSEDASTVRIADVDALKAEALVKDLKKIRSNVAASVSQSDLRSVDIVINATPLGLNNADPSPVDVSLLTDTMVVCDLIYKETPLLKAAAGRGCRTLDGLGMLLHQGVLAFEIWTGIRPPVEVMRKTLLGSLRH